MDRNSLARSTKILFLAIASLYVCSSTSVYAQRRQARVNPSQSETAQVNSNGPCNCKVKCPKDPTCSCCIEVAGVQTDLSGTYTGTLSCAGLPISGEGTLAITGNQFTFTPTGGGGSASGRIAAVTTRGYTAVALQFGESVAPPAGQSPAAPPVIISLHARKMGDNLMLSGVKGTATSDCIFSPVGTTKSGGRRRRR